MSGKQTVNVETVNALFDNMRSLLPAFVPAMPSIKLGIFVTLVITILGLVIALIDKKNQKDNKDVLQKTRWILVALVSLMIGIYIGDYVKDKNYAIRSLNTNKQHFANVHWLKSYIKAYRNVS